MAFVTAPGSAGPVIELIETSAPAADLADVQPPHLGLFALAFEAEDLAVLADRCSSAGYPAAGPVVETELPPHGRVKTVRVDGPHDVKLELFQAF
jgi:hypothetical protein